MAWPQWLGLNGLASMAWPQWLGLNGLASMAWPQWLGLNGLASGETPSKQAVLSLERTIFHASSSVVSTFGSSRALPRLAR
ncbi:hypothetical protein ACA910_016896 [Epithemia clementina (nom. ined.)]